MEKQSNKEFEYYTDLVFYLHKVSEPSSNETFWGPRMDEILPYYENELKNNPENIKNILKAYAWHAYNYALKQRG